MQFILKYILRALTALSWQALLGKLYVGEIRPALVKKLHDPSRPVDEALFQFIEHACSSLFGVEAYQDKPAEQVVPLEVLGK